MSTTHFSYIDKQQTMSSHGILVFLEGISHIICTADLAEIEQNDLVNRFSMTDFFSFYFIVPVRKEAQTQRGKLPKYSQLCHVYSSHYRT